MKTRVCLKYFVNDCLWKQFFATNSPQTPSNLILFTSLSVSTFDNNMPTRTKSFYEGLSQKALTETT